MAHLLARLVAMNDGWAKPFGDFNHRWLTALFRPIRPVKDFLNGTWLGHPLHAVLTDVPIGAFTLALVLDFFGQHTVRRHRDPRRRPVDGRRRGRRVRGLHRHGRQPPGPGRPSTRRSWSSRSSSTSPRSAIRAGGPARPDRAGRPVVDRVPDPVRRGVRRRRRRLSSSATWSTAMPGAAAARSGSPSSPEGGDDDPRGHAGQGEARHQQPRAHPAGRDDPRARTTSAPTPAGRCPQGTLVDGAIECPWHGSRFRLTDGRLRRGPALYDQPAYEVRRGEHGWEGRRTQA